MTIINNNEILRSERIGPPFLFLNSRQSTGRIAEYFKRTMLLINAMGQAKLTFKGNKTESGGASYFTVKFDTAGGSAVPDQIVLPNYKVIQPANPTKSGKAFDDWTLDGASYSFSTPVTKDITLVATWI